MRYEKSIMTKPTIVLTEDPNPFHKNRPFYFTFDAPSCYLTNNLTIKEAKLIVKTFEQLGFTVLNRTI